MSSLRRLCNAKAGHVTQNVFRAKPSEATRLARPCASTDREPWLMTVAERLVRSNWTIQAQCPIANHQHLLIAAPERILSAGVG